MKFLSYPVHGKVNDRSGLMCTEQERGGEKEKDKEKERRFRERKVRLERCGNTKKKNKERRRRKCKYIGKVYKVKVIKDEYHKLYNDQLQEF